MAEKIDMSLDEIIKRDRIGTGRRGRTGKFSTRPGAGGRGGLGGRRNQIRKIGATARQMKASVRPKRNLQSFGRKQANQIPDKWLHDKFTNDAKSSTLMISNLDYGVSDQDIRELFSEFGPLKKAAVHYDSSGRSLGKAEVIFFKLIDSVRALKKYNGVPLDGRPMMIQPVVKGTIQSASIVSRIGTSNPMNQKKQNIKGRNPIRGRRGRGGKMGQRGLNRGVKKVPTAAELDADLDAYANKI